MVAGGCLGLRVGGAHLAGEVQLRAVQHLALAELRVHVGRVQHVRAAHAVHLMGHRPARQQRMASGHWRLVTGRARHHRPTGPSPQSQAEPQGHNPHH